MGAPPLIFPLGARRHFTYMPNLHDAAKMSQFRLAMSYAGGGSIVLVYSMIITLAKLNVFSLLSALS